MQSHTDPSPTVSAACACVRPPFPPLVRRALVRQVDCVTVKGSNRPVGLFTYDVDLSGLDSLRCLSMQKTVGHPAFVFVCGSARAGPPACLVGLVTVLLWRAAWMVRFHHPVPQW